MIPAPAQHVRLHARFYAAAGVGVLSWLVAASLAGALRLLIAGDIFFVVYLALTALLALNGTPADMRKRAAYEDEGSFIIILMTVIASAISLGAIFTLVNREETAALQFVLAIASIPLGWVTLHTVMAFHYAHLYYTPAGREAKHGDAGGLEFPGTKEPQTWDFLYQSFVVGMTCQVSDVPVTATALRRVTLAHGVVSFFFNTTVIALAVNLATR
ncbi:MAG: DUF1345 domain-containing protein [Acidimicrobiia bacterium]